LTVHRDDDLPPPRRLRPVPPPTTAKPQPDSEVLVEAVHALTGRVTSLESKMSVLFKRSVITVVCADVLLGALKLGVELLTK
jgi:hypothetical protein